MRQDQVMLFNICVCRRRRRTIEQQAVGLSIRDVIDVSVNETKEEEKTVLKMGEEKERK